MKNFSLVIFMNRDDSELERLFADIDDISFMEYAYEKIEKDKHSHYHVYVEFKDEQPTGNVVGLFASLVPDDYDGPGWREVTLYVSKGYHSHFVKYMKHKGHIVTELSRK